MEVRDGNDPTRRRGGRGACRRRRGLLAAALPTIVVLFCLVGPVTAAGAAAAQAPVLALLAVQQAELTAGDAAAGDWFGYSVALSGDMALVGARYHAVAGKAGAGVAYVFVRSGGAWMQKAELMAVPGVADDQFGYSVALSGETALVGAPSHTVAGKPFAGAAYVFVRSGESWSRQAELTAADARALDRFGASLALSGETALIGAARHDTGGKPFAGAAYVFARAAGAWTQQAELHATDGAENDSFGCSVALSGETALVGAWGHATAGQRNAGAAYVFARVPGMWTQQAELTAGDTAAGDHFGREVTLAGDTALISAELKTVAGNDEAGAAYVFRRSARSWTQQARLTAADAATNDYFGSSLALSGEAALIGAPGHDIAGQSSVGAAYVFTFTAGAWAQEAELTAADGAVDDWFGNAVAFSGATALIGAVWHTVAGKASAGATYVFVIVPTVSSFLPAAGPVGTTVVIAGSGFSGATAVTFDGTAATSFTVDSDVQITAVVPAGAGSGRITVTTPGGSGTSLTSFGVIPAPSITLFAPSLGPAGTPVSIAGSGFTGATAVTLRRSRRRRLHRRIRRADQRHRSGRRHHGPYLRHRPRRRRHERRQLHGHPHAQPHQAQAHIGEARRHRDHHRYGLRRAARLEHRQVRRQAVRQIPLLERYADQVQGAGEGQVRQGPGHGDDRRRREQQQELQGEAAGNVAAHPGRSAWG